MADFRKERAGCNALAGAGSVVVPPHAAKHSLGWRQSLTKGYAACCSDLRRGKSASPSLKRGYRGRVAIGSSKKLKFE